MKDNYISDPAILPEILEKLPNLTLLECKGNSFRDKIPDFRKTMIARLPKLRYLDERPVTEEDRRRAHAFAEGKLPAERIEIKVIKEEKEEKRKVDIEELNDFVQLRTEEKKEE